MTSKEKIEKVRRLVAMIKAATTELDELMQSQAPEPRKTVVRKISFKKEIEYDYAMTVEKRRLKAK